MIKMLFGDVSVIRCTYVLWLNNTHPTLSLIASLKISTGYLAFGNIFTCTFQSINAK